MLTSPLASVTSVVIFIILQMTNTVLQYKINRALSNSDIYVDGHM